MKRKERQQKLHNSLINMLYPSASPSPSPSSLPPHHQFDEQTLHFEREIVNSDSYLINTDELEEEKEEEDERSELGFQKLTRAQRKRLRKHKLKEAASKRREIIGPQLPLDDQIGGEVSEVLENECPEGVRRNVAERHESGNDDNHRTEVSSCSKVKHRRKSKNNARAKLTPPPTNDSHGGTNHGVQI